jgi:PIN domain nuclease of toxin-antitoxin system
LVRDTGQLLRPLEHHNHPLDRRLIDQAQIEGLTLIGIVFHP